MDQRQEKLEGGTPSGIRQHLCLARDDRSYESEDMRVPQDERSKLLYVSRAISNRRERGPARNGLFGLAPPLAQRGVVSVFEVLGSGEARSQRGGDEGGRGHPGDG